MPEHKVWIDTVSGTWGIASNLFIVDLTEVVKADGNPDDEDEYSLYAALDSMSDREICDFGERYGKVIE